jgi:hypothetical protein
VLLQSLPVLSADPAPAPPTAPAASPAAPTAEDAALAEKKEQSRGHFERGLTLLRQEAWGPALAEFLASRDLFPTRNATNNAAVCLRKLQRYDEALDMFEVLLRDYQNLSTDDKTAAQRAIAELRELVGTVEIAESQPGAIIAIDGQTRGEYPTLEPLRVNAGPHQVRVYKEGYETYEGRIDVLGGRTVRVAAKLRPLATSGRLKVTEQGGKRVDVLVDNVVVGKSPWEGLLGTGDHTVVLRGEGKLGTQPAVVRVKQGETVSLSLRAEELDASMRIEPVPAGAAVSIDAVPIGRGLWAGRLRSGSHRLEVSSEGFLTRKNELNLRSGEHRTVRVELERDEEAPQWRKPSKLTVELASGFALAPSYGGDVATACSSDCTSSLGMGGLVALTGTYELGSGVGFGLSVGYLGTSHQTSGHDGDLVPAVNQPARPALIDDDLALTGFMAGVLAGARFGERFPLTLRLGAGGYFAKLRAVRGGSFVTRASETFSTDDVEQKVSTTYVYVDPEVRLGARFWDNFEVAAGVHALMLIAPSQPRWDDQIEVDAGTDGIGSYTDDSLTGSLVFVPTPTVSVRYDY